MAHPTLFFCLLVARLGPHACDQGAPDQENRPTPMTLLTSSTSLNNPLFAFSLYRQMVATTPGRNTIFPPLGISACRSPGQDRSTHPGPGGTGVQPVPSPRQRAPWALQSIPLCPPASPWGMPDRHGSILFGDQKKYLYRSLLMVPRICTTQRSSSSPSGMTG